MADILLVDDDPLVAEVLSRALARKGHDVTQASDGIQGLQKFSEAHFDLIITDIVMPHEEGLGMIRKIRRADLDIKIIAISGGGSTGNVEFLRMAEKLGASATIPKPIRFEDLFQTVEACLAKPIIAV